MALPRFTRVVGLASWLAASCALACMAEWVDVKTYQDVVMLDTEILVTNSRTPAQEDQVSTGPLRSFAVAPDGSAIALVNKQARRVRINDASGTQTLLVFEKQLPQLLAWSRDSKRFAMAENGVGVTVAEPAAKTSRLVKVPGLKANLLAFAPDQRTLLFTTDSGLWAVDGEGAKQLLTQPGITLLEVGPALAAIADKTGVFTFDPAKKQPPTLVLSVAAHTITWTIDGKALFIAHLGMTWVPLSGASRGLVIDGERQIHTLAPSPDGKWVVAATDERLTFLSASGAVLYQTAGGSAVRWKRDSSAVVVAYGQRILAIDPVLGREQTLTSGLPFESKLATESLMLVEPDFLGPKLVYSVLRAAGVRKDASHE